MGPWGVSHNEGVLVVLVDSENGLRQAFTWNNTDLLYPCPTKLEGGGGILDSPCPSVRLSVDDMVSGA